VTLSHLENSARIKELKSLSLCFKGLMTLCDHIWKRISARPSMMARHRPSSVTTLLTLKQENLMKKASFGCVASHKKVIP